MKIFPIKWLIATTTVGDKVVIVLDNVQYLKDRQMHTKVKFMDGSHLKLEETLGELVGEHGEHLSTKYMVHENEMQEPKAKKADIERETKNFQVAYEEAYKELQKFIEDRIGSNFQ